MKNLKEFKNEMEKISFSFALTGLWAASGLIEARRKAREVANTFVKRPIEMHKARTALRPVNQFTFEGGKYSRNIRS